MATRKRSPAVNSPLIKLRIKIGTTKSIYGSKCANFIKLSDFGISKEMEIGRSVVTVTSVSAGTEGYKPPELYQTHHQISPLGDIFSLGLVIFVIFTQGKHPFGDDRHDCIYNIKHNRNRDLSRISCLQGLSSWKIDQLEHMLHRMLERLPTDRPSAGEVRKDAFFCGKKAT